MSDPLLFVLVLVLLPALCITFRVFRYRMNQPSRRGAQRWIFDGGLRLVAGGAPGVTRRWRHGRVVVEPGLLTLRPYLLGLRFLPAKPVSVAVSGVDLAAEREAGLKDVLGVDPGSRLVVMRTMTGATLQLALRSSKTDEVFAVLPSGPAASELRASSALLVRPPRSRR